MAKMTKEAWEDGVATNRSKAKKGYEDYVKSEDYRKAISKAFTMPDTYADEYIT